MMLTWKLWRAVQNPPFTHPIFLRAFEAPAIPFHRYGYTIWILFSPLLLCGLSFSLRQAFEFVFVFAFLQLYILYVGVHSLTWAMNVSSAIVKEQEAKTHDLLCVTPIGSVGAYWAIFTGCIYRKSEFLDFSNGSTWIIRFLFALPTIAVTILFAYTRVTRIDPITVLVYFVLLMIAFYVDHVQSVLLASLTGMLVPNYTHNPVESRLFVLGSFLTVQGISYFLVGLIGFVLLSAVYDAIPQKSIYLEISLPVLRLIVFYAIRDGIIRLLWGALGRQLNTSDLELTLMTTLKPKQIDS